MEKKRFCLQKKSHLKNSSKLRSDSNLLQNLRGKLDSQNIFSLQRPRVINLGEFVRSSKLVFKRGDVRTTRSIFFGSKPVSHRIVKKRKLDLSPSYQGLRNILKVNPSLGSKGKTHKFPL